MVEHCYNNVRTPRPLPGPQEGKRRAGRRRLCCGPPHGQPPGLRSRRRSDPQPADRIPVCTLGVAASGALPPLSATRAIARGSGRRAAASRPKAPARPARRRQSGTGGGRTGCGTAHAAAEGRRRSTRKRASLFPFSPFPSAPGARALSLFTGRSAAGAAAGGGFSAALPSACGAAPQQRRRGREKRTPKP